MYLAEAELGNIFEIKTKIKKKKGKMLCGINLFSYKYQSLS